MMTSAFSQPLPLGAVQLPNRVVMAPLTRCRASAGRVPNALMAEYYAQRASSGMILSEGTVVEPRGVGYPDTPGIWSEEQVEGWKPVTEAVHRAGGLIFCQLWHVGRVSDPYYLDGQLPVAPSALAVPGKITRLKPPRDYVVPHALSGDEIGGVVDAFARATANARAAGFDGVELHGANGYLIDQFLQRSSNQREDDYGGPIAQRIRFLSEVVDAVNAAWNADRTGVHLYLRGGEDPDDPDGRLLFSAVGKLLREKGIAFICAREPWSENWILPTVREAFGGPVIANQGLNRDTALHILQTQQADAVAFGRPYIANPDLLRRLEEDLPWNQPEESTFYGQGPRGYTDYPFYS